METNQKVYIEMFDNQFKPAEAIYIAQFNNAHHVAVQKTNKGEPIFGMFDIMYRQQVWLTKEAFWTEHQSRLDKKRKELDDWQKSLDKEKDSQAI